MTTERTGLLIACKGCKINCSNCGLKSLSATCGSASSASLIKGRISGMDWTSWVAMVVNKKLALPRSPSPFLKKKLAPSCVCLSNSAASVRAIVVLPKPAIWRPKGFTCAIPCSRHTIWGFNHNTIPFNQNTHLLAGFIAHFLNVSSRLTLVSGKHRESNSSISENELYAAPFTKGSFVMSIFSSMLSRRALIQPCQPFAKLIIEFWVWLTYGRFGRQSQQSLDTQRYVKWFDQFAYFQKAIWAHVVLPLQPTSLVLQLRVYPKVWTGLRNSHLNNSELLGVILQSLI